MEEYVTIRSQDLKFRKKDGSYTGADMLLDKTTEERIEAVKSASAEQIQSITQKGVDVMNQIPDDYTEINEKVKQLNEAITDISDDINQYKGLDYIGRKVTDYFAVSSNADGFPSTTLVGNSLVFASGASAHGAYIGYRIPSDYIDKIKGKYIHLEFDVSYSEELADTLDTLILSGIGVIVVKNEISNNKVRADIYVDKDSTTTYLMLSIRKKKYYISDGETSITVSNPIAILSSHKDVHDNIDAKIDSLSPYSAVDYGFSKFADVDWKQGSYSNTTGAYSNHSKRICSADYLPTNITRIVAVNDFNVEVFVYDISNASYVGVWVDTTMATSTNNVFYKDICLASIYAQNHNYRVKIMVTDYNNSIDVTASKNILCFLSDNKIGKCGLNKLFSFGDSYTMMQRWQKYVVNDCGLQAYDLNALIGGTCVERFGYIENCPSDADLITVWYGTNDWATNVVIGSINDSVAIKGTTANTFISAMKYIMEWIATNRKTARVLLITHTQRFDTQAMDLANVNGYIGQFPKNNNGNTLKDFADAIKAVGAEYGYPVCDLQSIAGINVKNYSQYYDSDKLHPSYNGGKYLARLIAKKVNEVS